MGCAPGYYWSLYLTSSSWSGILWNILWANSFFWVFVHFSRGSSFWVFFVFWVLKSKGISLIFLCFLEAFLEMWRDPGTPADSYYQVRPECTDVPKTRFKIKVCFLFLFFYNIYNIRIFRYPFGFFRYICIHTHIYIYMAWIKEGGNK